MPVEFTRQADQPLYPDVFWNRPTISSRAGRLLIVGGQKSQFAQIQGVYQIAEAAGIGEVQAAMPDVLQRLLGGSEFGRFLPSSQSGSLGRAALGELLYLAEDYDGIVIGANLTNNSETAIMIESLITKTDQPLIITEETIELLKFHPELITGNPRALVVVTMPGLFALANNLHMPIAIKRDGGVLRKLEILHQLASISRASYVVYGPEILVSAGGRLGITPLSQPIDTLPAAIIGTMATFWLQQRTKPFEGLMTAAYIIKEASDSQQGASLSSLTAAIRQALQQHE
jgi:NAD(P)H-hydrate repair Nnr-like enzyme with NAD(P)H-hydrate dehydratase domain